MGPAQNIRQALTYYVITKEVSVITQSTMQSLADLELSDLIDKMDYHIKDNHKKHKITPHDNIRPLVFDTNPNDKDQRALTLNQLQQASVEDSGAIQDDFDESSMLDKYISAEVQLPKGDTYITGMVQNQKWTCDGSFVGKAHDNPMVDTQTYEVELPDGHMEEYLANIIAESMYACTNYEGDQLLILDSECVIISVVFTLD